jgi:exosome complex component RRP4
MAITILAPAPATTSYYADSDSSGSDEDDGGVDLDGDFDMRPKKRVRHHGSSSIVTPGETVTDDPQWMR